MLERRLADARSDARTTAANNERLAATLREARDQIISLKSEVDRLAQPPASFGVFLAPAEEHTADIYTSGRKMRVSVSPDVDLEALIPGKEVMVNEAMNVVDVLEFDEVGEVVLLKEVLEDGDRGLVVGHGDEESVVRLAHRLREQNLRSGDSLLIDRRVHFAYERIPKLDVEELVLEEVPDIDYSVIGGLGSQIEAIRDAVELPFLHKDLFDEHELKAPEGDPALRPARLRQDPDRQGGGQLAGQEGHRAHRGGGAQLLPQHQGPRAAEQVRRRDRAAHPAGLPAGPGQGQRRHAGDRVLRRDGLAVPHPRVGRELRRGEHHRAPAAERDRRRRGPGQRHHHRRLEPRGHDRPGDPAARPAGRQDQDRAAGRRGGPGDLQQVPDADAAAAPRGPGRVRPGPGRPASRA